MKHYENFKEAFAAASLDFSLWSPVVKHATMQVIKGTGEIQIKIFQEYKSPIMWSTPLASEIERHSFKPEKTEKGFDCIIINYVYNED